jgi:membrane protein YdbS with pleckstrin-like domain
VPLPRKFLNDDEELLAEMHPHWIFILVPLATSVVGIAGIVAILVALGNSANWATYPLLVVAAIPAVWLIGRIIRWRSYILALTNTRIVLRHGVFDRDVVQLRLQRITEINLSQKLWERALGTGRLIIDVQGEDDSMVIPDVRKPNVVQRVINAQINELIGGGSAEAIPSEFQPRRPYGGQDVAPSHDDDHGHDTPPFGVPIVQDEPVVRATIDPTTPTPSSSSPGGAIHSDIRDRLIELEDLRQRGIISDEEFATKKAQLLDRI